MGKKQNERAMKLLVFAMFLAVFVFVNAGQYVAAAATYMGMGIVSLIFYNQWSKVGRKSDLEGLNDNFIKDAFVGLVLGIFTIILGNIFSFIGAIGIPPVASVAGTIGRFLIIVPCAAIFEEVFFRDQLMDFLNSKLGLNKLFSILITACAFATFHLAAYGGSLSAAGGSFLSAGIMGFIFGIVTEKQNSLAGSIFYHGILNLYIGFVTLGVIVS